MKVPKSVAPRSPGFLLILESARIAPWPTTALVSLMAVTVLVPPALAVLSGELIGALSNTGERDAGGDRDLLWIVVAIGVFFFLQQALAPLLLLLAESLGRQVDRSLRVRVIQALATPETIETLETGKTRGLLSDINGGLGMAKAVDALSGLVNIGVIRWGSIAGLALFLPYRWWLALLVAAAYIVAMSIGSRVYQIGLQSSEGDPVSGRRARYVQELAATPAASKDIRIFGLTDWLRATRHTEWLRGIREDRSARSGVQRVSIVNGLLVLATQGLLLFVLYSDFRSGVLSVSSFTSLLVVVVGLGTALSLSSEMVSVSVGGAKVWAVRQLEAFLQRSDRQGDGTAQALSKVAPPASGSTIVFEDVWFRYPGSSADVLRGLSFEMSPGSSTALVGLNGAGKSTVVKLMAGFYRPDRGRIFVDGVDLNDSDRAEWQKQCAVLSQTWIRWGLSIRENVLWGAAHAEPNEENLADVAHASGVGSIVTRLPQGWETPLSREFGGVDLSGGQWQRVGLARALYAQAGGARLLVMDEPTAALDVAGETEINSNLLNSTIGQTLLLVSHRFAGVRQADRILVLANGQLAEQGNHESLMKADRLYAQMFLTQAERYVDEDRTHEE